MSATLTLGLTHFLELDSGELLAAARRGETVGQNGLFDAHKHRVARQILRMTGDPGSVDDLVQEVFVAAFRRINDFRGDAHIETWLFRITVNKVTNWLDSARRRAARELRAAPRATDLQTSTLDEELAATQRMERFYEALHGLPVNYREAFIARALENQSLQQASESLGVPVSTVSYRARRAEKMLVEVLGLESTP